MGIATSPLWVSLEHAAWDAFEDVFLLIAIRQNVSEMKLLAKHTSSLENGICAAEESQRLAQSASRLKSRFLENMSHEIRTPLNSILGFTDLILKDRNQVVSGEHKDYLLTVRNSGNHLMSLINDILDLSRIESGQLTLNVSDCSPVQVIAETISLMRVRALEKGITPNFRCDGPIPASIKTDSHRLKQLLINLIGNSIKCTGQGSVLVVAILDDTNEEPQFVIEVRDTGVGIPEDKLEVIFEAFVQADSSVTRKHGGTGLGLAISRRIATALGGGLSAHSVVGRGSTFVVRVATGNLTNVRLLKAPLQSVHACLEISTVATSDLQGKRVLVVDDGDINRKLIRVVLERAGACVQTAENGEIAIARMELQEFDAVLMDMQMQVLDGDEATRRLRKSGCNLPIFALTANAMMGDKEKCLAVGCSGYIAKPVYVDAMLKSLADALDPNRAESQSSRTQSHLFSISNSESVPLSCL